MKRSVDKIEKLWDATVVAGGLLNHVARTDDLKAIKDLGQNMIDRLYDFMEYRGIITKRMQKRVIKRLNKKSEGK